jgi:aldehyde dehydrogenase (NAD+)
LLTCRTTCGFAQEEIFGPVLAIVRARDFTDAMTLANATPLGLAASVQTTNVSRVFEFVNQMEAGLLTVNLPRAGVEYHLPLRARRIRASAPRSRGRPRSNSTASIISSSQVAPRHRTGTVASARL